MFYFFLLVSCKKFFLIGSDIYKYILSYNYLFADVRKSTSGMDGVD